MLRISWTEMRTNAEVLRSAAVKRELIKTIRRRHEIYGAYSQRDGIEMRLMCDHTSQERQGKSETDVWEKLQQLGN